MPQWHGSMVKRKPTGGRKRAWRGKRSFEMGGQPTETTIGGVKKRYSREFGGNVKVKLAQSDWAIVTDKTSGKISKTKLLRVIRNPANVDYQRRRVITKGAIIETQVGQARVTSRPGQDGMINAVLTGKEGSSSAA